MVRDGGTSNAVSLVSRYFRFASICVDLAAESLQAMRCALPLCLVKTGEMYICVIIEIVSFIDISKNTWLKGGAKLGLPVNCEQKTLDSSFNFVNNGQNTNHSVRLLFIGGKSVFLTIFGRNNHIVQVVFIQIDKSVCTPINKLSLGIK